MVPEFSELRFFFVVVFFSTLLPVHQEDCSRQYRVNRHCMYKDTVDGACTHGISGFIFPYL